MTKPLPPGRVLLNRLLTEKQRSDLDKYGLFTEHNVQIQVDPQRNYVYTGACISICGQRRLPVYDQAIAFLLFIRADPAGYAQTANHDRTWPPRRPRFGGAW